MSVQKLTYSRALRVYPSSFCNIPNPASFIVSGLSTSTISNALRDGTTNFVQKGVKIGDIVYDNTGGDGATVISIIDDNTLELNSNIFSSGDSYSIYGGHQNTLSNQGCVLYFPEISQSTNIILDLITVGGDSMNIQVFNGESIFPVQVVKLISCSGAVYALW